MRFGVVIGNPPYQEECAAKLSRTLYTEFMAMGQRAGRSLCMIVPSRWTEETSNNDLRNAILYRGHLRSIRIFLDGKSIFPGITTNKLCYFLYDECYVGDANVVNTLKGRNTVLVRNMLHDDGPLANNEISDLLRKVRSRAENERGTIQDMYLGRIFNIRTNDLGDSESPTTIRMLTNSGWKDIERHRVSKPWHIDKYKVYVSRASCEHGGEPNKQGMYKIVANHGVLTPGQVCTDSYIILGEFDDEESAHNFHKYVLTKFFRVLVSISLSSVYMSEHQFKRIPKQDFTSNSDICWSASMDGLDAQLYRKYGFTPSEVGYIDRTIKSIPWQG